MEDAQEVQNRHRDRERLSVQIDRSQMRALRALAVNGLSLSAVVRRAITYYLGQPVEVDEAMVSRASRAQRDHSDSVMGEMASPGEIRAMLTAALEVEGSTESGVVAIAELATGLSRVNGHRWVDVEDPQQLAIAKACWARDQRDDYPSVFPFAPSYGQRAGYFDPSSWDVDTMWGLVDQSIAWLAAHVT